MAASSYKLELETQKRSVFVTQLNQRDDEEEDVHAIPIVKESAGRLLENGINTLQKTLLLKKEVEVEHVQEELQEKRAEFRDRMEACSQRQVEIQKRQQKMKDRVAKFEKFIKENEAKRRRAIQKYQTEVKLKEQKSKEFDTLEEQLADLRERHAYLKDRLAKFKKYEEYLMKVLDILPDQYLETREINVLMMRHNALNSTNETLMENLLGTADELERLKGELKDMNEEHDKQKLSINSKLSQMQHSQEAKTDKNQESEQHFVMEKIELRSQREEFGRIIMAIENIADKCRRRMDPTMETLNLTEKLDLVKEYLVDRADVAGMAQPDGMASPTSERRSARSSPKKRELAVRSTVGFAV